MTTKRALFTLPLAFAAGGLLVHCSSSSSGGANGRRLRRDHEPRRWPQLRDRDEFRQEGRRREQLNGEHRIDG